MDPKLIRAHTYVYIYIYKLIYFTNKVDSATGFQETHSAYEALVLFAKTKILSYMVCLFLSPLTLPFIFMYVTFTIIPCVPAPAQAWAGAVAQLR